MQTSAEEREARVRADLNSLRIDRGPAAAQERRRRRRPRLLVAALALAALITGFVAFRAVGRATPVTVGRAVHVVPGEAPFMPVLSGSGYVVTGERYISIGVRVPGRIDRYFVEEGEHVRQGDVLVQLDDRDYRATVARAEAVLRVANANRTLAESELARGRELRAKAVISQQELDVLQNKIEVTRATVAQVEADLAQVRINLEYTTLRAPSDGVVLAKLKEVGEIAVPGGFAGSGDLIRLANLTDLRAEVDVNESDLNRVRLGQSAQVTPDAYPDARYPAEVVKLYPQVDRQKGTLKIEVRILEPDAKLLPDMSVRISFLDRLPQEQAGHPAVLVPSAAVRRDGSDRTFVWKVDQGRVRRVAVETGGQVGDQVRITSGLAADDVVVVSDDKNLRDGSAVTLADS